MRVVSLLASATEIVCELGAGGMLVGRSHECDNPAWVRRLPACSRPAFDVSVSSREIDAEVKRRLRAKEPLYHLDADLIRDLRPDLLLTQAHCDVCAVTPGNVERSGLSPMRQLALSAGCLDEIFGGIRAIARAVERPEQGDALVDRERARLEAVRERTARLRRPTLVTIEWTDPLFVMANWAPELVDLANGEALLARPGEFSVSLSADCLIQADPEYLIVAPCGFNLERALRERDVLESYPFWRELQAVRQGNVAFADGNLFFNRSGMTISRTAEIIAEIVHGISFGDPGEGLHWCWTEARAGRDSRSEKAIRI